MKKKITYLILFVFCLSFFSMAKQNGKECDGNCPVRMKAAKIAKANSAEKGFGQLPFQVFIFNI